MCTQRTLWNVIEESWELDARRHARVRLEETDRITVATPGERKLTQKEIYEELGGPIEYDAKIYTERTSHRTGGHSDAKD